jgi:hypothetical protein
MATLHGAATLGLDQSGFMLRTGSSPLAVVAVETDPSRYTGAPPLEAALRSAAAARVLFRRQHTVRA